MLHQFSMDYQGFVQHYRRWHDIEGTALSIVCHGGLEQV